MFPSFLFITYTSGANKELNGTAHTTSAGMVVLFFKLVQN